MSLLAGLAGFGAGVTASLAETKKEEMATQRQANLARLSAQYKSSAEERSRLAAEARRREILAMPRPAGYREALVADETEIAEALAPAEAAEPKWETVQNFKTGESYTANTNDPVVQAQLANREIGLVSEQTPSERFVERTDPDGTLIRVDTMTGKEFVRINREWREIPPPARTERTGTTSGAVSSTARDLTGEAFLQANITETAPGIAPAYRRFISRIPVVAEIASDIPSDVQGQYGEQQAIATRLIARTKNRILSEEAQSIMGDGEANRLTNLMLELSKQSANMEFGLFSTPQSLVNDIKSNLIAINDELARQEELKDDMFISEAARQKANTYLTVFEPIAQDLQHMADVHDVKDVVIGNRRLIELSKQEAIELGRRVQREREQGSVFLNRPQIEALGKLLRLYGE